MNEHEPTAQERREAEALARALEGDGSAEDIPEDAFSCAALLRFSQSGHEMSAKESIGAELHELAQKRATIHQRSRRKRWFWAPLGGLATAAGTLAILFAVLTPEQASCPTPLPQPSAQLLQIQSQAAAGDADAIGRLADEMGRYRGSMYSALTQRYEEGGE